MNRYDIIRMAEEASGGRQPNGWGVMLDHEQLERFAKLVASEERKAVLEMIDEFIGMERDRNAMFSDGYDYALHQVTEFVLARGRR